MIKIRTLHLVLIAIAAAGLGSLAGAQVAKAPREIRATPLGELTFTPRDPKNPNGPAIALLFGDLNRRAPVGYLLKVPAGFRPGPHTHTSDDHGVVVKGVMHNFAAGQAEGPALGPGGTWFQPGGVLHDNHCEDGSECIIFFYLPGGFDFLKPK